jgi:hypothetical protein
LKPSKKTTISRKLPDNDLYKVIVTPDRQVPFHDEDSHQAICDYVSASEFDEWVDLGDFMDFDQISRFSAGNLRAVAGRRIMEDYEVGRRVLDENLAALRASSDKPRFTLLEGNHDVRIEKWLDFHPEMVGAVELQNGLGFDERAIDFVRCYSKGESYRIGKQWFHHGLYHGNNHARKHVSMFGSNIAYGHTHDVQSYTQARLAHDGPIVGQSLGCLCREDLSYIKGRPTNWQQAFGEWTFFPDGTFSYNVTRIINGRFVAPGTRKVYGRKWV